MNLTSSHEVVGSIPGLDQWVRIWCCCELQCRSRCGLDPELLWLWCRLVATAPIRPQPWEPPYALGAALEKVKRRKKKKKKKKKEKKLDQMPHLVYHRLSFKIRSFGSKPFALFPALIFFLCMRYIH